MTPERYILDASVAAKWYLNDEDFVAEAELYLLRLLAGDIEFHAPILLWYELGHILAKAQRRSGRSLSATEAQEAYRTFCQLPISCYEQDAQMRQDILAFANQHHRGFYDSSYVCLAIALGCPWLTSERRYGGQLPPGFPVGVVLPLESSLSTP
jgi:predicted nucleic acid-binding protein